MPITAFITSQSTTPVTGELAIAEVVRRLEGLRELRACMWEGFGDLEEEVVSRAVRQSMEIQLGNVRQALERLVEMEGGERGGYVVPRIVLE